MKMGVVLIKKAGKEYLGLKILKYKAFLFFLCISSDHAHGLVYH
jgi:hypothetical protein